MKGRIKHIRHYIAYIIAPDMIDDLERRLSSFLENQTGGRLSKPYYSVNTMISEASDRQQRICEECRRTLCNDCHYKAVNDGERGEGEWVQQLKPYEDEIICSVCGANFNVIDNCTEKFNHCPNCGAKMKDVTDINVGNKSADVVEVVRCKDCAVPHNRWTGCPNLNGLIPPPDFYCAKGERSERE